MLAELKQTLLLNDTTTLAQIAQERHAQLNSKKTAVKQRVLALKEEVDRTVWELERAYYGEVVSSHSTTSTTTDTTSTGGGAAEAGPMAANALSMTGHSA